LTGSSSIPLTNEEKGIYQLKYSFPKEAKKDPLGDKGRKPIIEEPLKIFTAANISQVQISKSNQYFFFGTKEKGNPGSLRITRYPFTEEIVEFQCHSQPVSCLKISFDDNYVFSAGEDGSLIIFEIKDKEAKA